MNLRRPRHQSNRTVAIGFVLLVWFPVSAIAQQQGTGNPGSTGSTTGTASATGSSTTSAFTPGGAQGSNLTGQGVQQPQLRAFGETLNQDSSAFVGRGAGSEFVGQRLAGQTNTSGPIGPQFGAVGGNQGGTNTGRGQTSGPSRAARLRPRHRVAFSFSPIRAETVSDSLQTHLRSLQDRFIGVTGVETSLTSDGTLVLRGMALDPEASQLAEAVARLEPGVRRVENRITVAPFPPELDGAD